MDCCVPTLIPASPEAARLALCPPPQDTYAKEQGKNNTIGMVTTPHCCSKPQLILVLKASGLNSSAYLLSKTRTKIL